MQASDGNFYGTTWGGGSNSCEWGCGTVYKITPEGALTTLYSFCAQPNCTDGINPYASLVQGTDGNFYGTTGWAGAYGYGTVFKITPAGALTTLYNFCAAGYPCADGQLPYASLVQATDGNFYGTTYMGGAYDYCYGPSGDGSCGTVFKVTPTGVLTTMYSFCSQWNCQDGVQPRGGLVQASDGNFYGTTSGTVFKITPSGTLSTLYTFCSQLDCSDGTSLWAGLVRAGDGSFYGTTRDGGANSRGTVFKITSIGTLTTLYSFCPQSSCIDGAYPVAPLVQATNGFFYGTASNLGFYGDGTVFRLGVVHACATCRP